MACKGTSGFILLQISDYIYLEKQPKILHHMISFFMYNDNPYEKQHKIQSLLQ